MRGACLQIVNYFLDFFTSKLTGTNSRFKAGRTATLIKSSKPYWSNLLPSTLKLTVYLVILFPPCFCSAYCVAYKAYLTPIIKGLSSIYYRRVLVRQIFQEYLNSRFIVRHKDKNSQTINIGSGAFNIRTIFLVVKHLGPDISRLTKLEPPRLNLDCKPIPIEQY